MAGEEAGPQAPIKLFRDPQDETRLLAFERALSIACDVLRGNRLGHRASKESMKNPSHRFVRIMTALTRP